MKISTYLRASLSDHLVYSIDFRSGPPPNPNATPTGDLLASLFISFGVFDDFDGSTPLQQVSRRLIMPVTARVEESALVTASRKTLYKAGLIGYARFTYLGGFSVLPDVVNSPDPYSFIASVGTTLGEAEVIVDSLEVKFPGAPVTLVSAAFHAPES